jgi:hypothetical protein
VLLGAEAAVVGPSGQGSRPSVSMSRKILHSARNIIGLLKLVLKDV